MYSLEEQVNNPFYTSMLMYIIVLIILIYSIDHRRTDVCLSYHIKFFIYSYVFFILINMYQSDYYYRKVQKDFRILANPRETLV